MFVLQNGWRKIFTKNPEIENVDFLHLCSKKEIKIVSITLVAPLLFTIASKKNVNPVSVQKTAFF